MRRNPSGSGEGARLLATGAVVVGDAVIAEEEEGGDESGEEGEGEGGSNEFLDKKPRGHRHEDKEAKKVRSGPECSSDVAER